jgi:hypothetical protein
MAGGYATPAVDANSYLVQEIKSLRDQIRELQRPTGTQLASSVATLTETVATLQATVTQLSNNNDAATSVSSYSGEALTGSNQQVASVSFARPGWATRCIVVAISSVTTNTTNQSTGPLTATMRTVVAGTASSSVGVSTQASSVYSTKVVPLNRSFATSAASIVVETRVDTSGGAAANALSAQLSAFVFWYA